MACSQNKIHSLSVCLHLHGRFSYLALLELVSGSLQQVGFVTRGVTSPLTTCNLSLIRSTKKHNILQHGIDVWGKEI